MADFNTDEQVSLKLVVNKETKKVLFAEAGKDFVDVLFSFLTLPLGTIVRLLGKESDMKEVKVGSLRSLYQSVANLGEECLSTDTCNEMLMQPRNSMEDYCRSLKLNIDDDTEPTQYYVCNNLIYCLDRNTVMCSTFKNKKCSCGNFLGKQISLQSSNVVDGFLKVNASFMITDDLNVVPNSLGSMSSLLKNLGIEKMSSVEEMTANVTKNQVMELLRYSVISKTTLTDVFLENKSFLENNELARLPQCDYAAEDSTRIDVNVMYRKSDCKVLFAQGNEDFADMLLSFLTFPLGGVVRLLEGNSSLGSVDGLYKSIVDLNEAYFRTKEIKKKLVDFRLAPQFKLSNQLLPVRESDTPTYFCYTEGYKNSSTLRSIDVFYLTDTYKNCNRGSYQKCSNLDMVDPISKTGSPKGFAQGPIVYLATDDLVLTPMSSISVVSLLNSMKTPVSDLEEKMVSIGIKECLNILKASLSSTSALTNGLGHLLFNVKEERNRTITWFSDLLEKVISICMKEDKGVPLL